MADAIFGIHGQALAIRSQRLSMLASNIANAATPNYKARDIDFAMALRGEADAVRYRVPVQPSLDGNTVELPTEQTAFAENAVQYRTTLAFLESRVATITRALKGE
jgi:flagellar basal-body rod protein FlgB